MFRAIFLNVCVHVYVAFAVIVETHNYAMYPARAGVGEVVGELSDASLMSCALECSISDECNSANYEPTNHTCTLLNVEDFQDDWMDSQENTYVCSNTEIDFTESLGFWSFIDDISNLWKAKTSVTTHNTPFVPAVPGGSTNVISFLGNKDSYVVLENNGDLAVTSFTWAAKVYPEAIDDDPLFNWELSTSAVCGYHGPHIWLVSGKLFFCVCNGASLLPASHTSVLSLNTWHDVAVSYDFTTGAAQLRADDITESYIVGHSGADHTGGPVVMGSRYYHSGTINDARSFTGRMACVRLWNIARDLESLRMNSPLCNMN